MEKPENNTIKHHNSKPKWDWMQVDCNLKTENNRRYVIWSLAPSIILTNPSAQGPDPHVKLYIDTQKSLQFSEELGWNWHKSWNLPNISIRVEIKDNSTGESLLAPKNLYAQLFAVKVMVDPHEKNQNAHLVDVGIRGISKIQMVDGQAYFTAMKFLSTSYNNQGRQMNQLRCKVLPFDQNEIPKILTATLSPPIFVDSRKSARDNQERKYSSFIEPFLVENLQKQFIKRENKRKNQNQIKIKNDFEGLFSYLTAPNIRHKVKHPIFLAIKFNNCAKLYFNTNLIPKTTSSNQMLIILQKKISKDHTSRRSTKTQCKNDDKMFILLIKESTDSFKNKKVQQSIDPLDCNSLGIIYKQQQLPPFFQNTLTLGNISNAYKQQYSQLYLIAKSIVNIQNSDEDNSDGQSQSQNQSQEQSSQSPIPVKKRFHKKYESEPEEDDDQQKQNSSNKKSENLNQNFQLNQAESINKKLNIPIFHQIARQNSENINANNLLNNNSQAQITQQNSNLQNNSISAPNNPNLGNIQQMLMNNMTLSNTLKNIKGYSNNPQNNLLNMIAAGNNTGKGLNIPSMNSQQSQQNQLLNSLLGNSFNPINNVGMNPINNLVGLSSPLNNQICSSQQINNLPQSNQKVGFSLVQQGQQQSNQQQQQQQQQQIYQQQQFQQIQQDHQLNNNPQTNILLLQQLAMYKDLLNQITFQNQLGFNLNNLLPGIGQNMQNLSQSGMQSLGQPSLGGLANLGISLGNGLGGLNLNNNPFNQFGSLQNQISQQQNILKMMQQLQSQTSQKQAKQQQE